MAAAITKRDFDNPSGVRMTLLTVVADATYPTGGYDISAFIPKTPGNLFALPALRYVSGVGGGLVPVIDAVNRKVALFESSTGAPLALVEAAASSVHVTTATIIDILLVMT